MSTSEPIRSTTILPQPVRNSTRLPAVIPIIKDDVLARVPGLRVFNDELRTWWKNARFAMQTDYEELAAGSNTAINSNSALAGAFRTEVSERKEGDETIISQVQELIVSDGGPNRIFLRTTAPSNPQIGDLWFDTDDGFRPWIYDGVAWVDTRDQTIAGAIAGISSEQTLRISADSALASRIDSTLARVTSAETGITGLSTSLASVQSTVTNQGGVITAQGTSITNLQSTVTNQAGTIAGQATSINAIQTTVTSQGGLVTSQATRIAALESTVNTAGSGLTAKISSIESTMATDTEVSAAKSDAISAAKVYTDGTKDSLLASIATDYATKVYADGSASAAQTNAITAASGYTDGKIANITTSYATKVYADGAASAAQANAVSAAASYADAKNKAFSQGTAPVASAVGDIWFNTSDGNKLFRWDGSTWAAAADTRIGVALDTANSKVRTSVQSNYPVAMAVGDLWIDTTNNDNILRRWSGATWVNVDIANGRLNAVSALVTVETNARVSADEAMATRLSTVETGLGNANASIASEQTTRAARDNAIAADVASLSAELYNPATGLARVNANIVTEQSARVAADSAGNAYADARKSEAISASKTYTDGAIGTESGNRTAAITVESNARVSADGNLSGKYTIAVDAGGRVAGMNITSTSGPGSNTSEIAFNADAFKVFNGSANEPVFEVSGGVTRIKCLNAGHVATSSQRFNTGDPARLMPIISSVSDQLGQVLASSLSIHPNWTYVSTNNLILYGWNNGAAGVSAKRFGNTTQTFIVSATGNGWGNSAIGDIVTYGPAFRTRVNGGAWGAWVGMGHDNYVTAPYSNVTRYDPIVLPGMTGTTDVQFGYRACRGSYGGAPSANISSCFLTVQAFNF